MADPLTRLAEAAEALTDPRTHRSPRHTWDANRHKVALPDHVTTLPGLIQQLRDMTEPGSGEEGPGAKSVPDSRPPVSLDAVSLLASIEFGTARRCLEFGLAPRDTLESTIRLIVGAASRLSGDKQRILSVEFGSWHRQAEVICRWQTGAVELVAPCPAVLDEGTCAARGSLLANPDTHAAWCIVCGTSWEPEDFDRLAEHVRRYTEASRAAAERSRAEVRAAKERGRTAGAEALAKQVGRDAA